MTTNVFATSFPALTGAPIMQGHADYCEANGHATHTVDGVVSGSCPRCGEWTLAMPTAEEMTATPATYCDAHYPLILDGYRLWCRLDAGHAGNHECETPDEAWSGSTYEWADQPECYTTF